MEKPVETSFLPTCPKYFLILSSSSTDVNGEHKIKYEYENQHQKIFSFDKFEKEAQKNISKDIECLNWKRKENKI